MAAEAVEAVDDDDEREAARRLVARKVGAMRRLDRTTATRRLMGMLARKGYNGGLAAAVIREALDGAAADDAASLRSTPRRGRPAAVSRVELGPSRSGRVGVVRSLPRAGVAAEHVVGVGLWRLPACASSCSRSIRCG